MHVKNNLWGFFMKKLLLIAIICTVSVVYCLQNTLFEVITPIVNSHIFATNFPTPGYPTCKRCGKYHPGQDCPKDKKEKSEIAGVNEKVIV